MPIYEYTCPTCDVRFEVLRAMSQSDAPATCPAGHEGAQRVLSSFANHHPTKPGGVVSDPAVFAAHDRMHGSGGHGHSHGPGTHTH
ncbi:MAG: zinc ribbon domain-containing protein [Chloroflexi bacterium]|nr:zinc ribbon domain-containing protein [Chloroflexota bacterium]